MVNFSEEFIKMNGNMSNQEKLQAIEFALFLGFQTESRVFPVTSLEDGIDVPETVEEFLKWLPEIREDSIPEEYSSATKNAKPIRDIDWRSKKGLENLFSKGLFLKDSDNNMLPDSLDMKIILPKDCDLSTARAACDVAFRFGMETTAYEGEIVTSEAYEGPGVYFVGGTDCELELVDVEKGHVALHGSGAELEEFVTHICETFPILAEGRTWSEALQEVIDIFCMKSLDGQLVYLEMNQDVLGEVTEAYVTPGDAGIRKARIDYPDVTFESVKSLKPIYEDSYDIPWEVDVFQDILKTEVYPRLKAGDTVAIIGALSEESDVREVLCNTIRTELEKLEVETTAVQILCAYKQGISWIQESVIPNIQAIGNHIEREADRFAEIDKPVVNKIEIAFKPFLPDGITDWGDEGGAIPKYLDLGTDNPDAWYDLPIRFLQELYPIEDIIAAQLGVEREAVVFSLAEEEQEETYLLKAFTNEVEVYRDTYTVSVSERPYMDEFVNKGKVHPCTGYINVVVNDKVVVNQSVKTDVEWVWDIYQNQVLPKVFQYTMEQTGGVLGIEKQPFFAELNMDITLSEPDYLLDSREDMISTLDALHEDMYFLGADYYRTQGLKHANIIIDAPGLILPVIHKGQGKPKFKVTLYDSVQEEPCLISGEQKITSIYARNDVDVTIQKITYVDSNVKVYLNIEGVTTQMQEVYIDLLDKGVLAQSHRFKGVDAIGILANTEVEAQIETYQKPIKDLSITEIDLMEETLIGYDAFGIIIEQLKRVPGIDVYPIATSYMGRDIYAIELLPKTLGYSSRTKRINNLPSEFINGRHHANEVSATNAMLILLKELLTNSNYDNLTEQMNLVMVPMENVDGTEIHYELQKENPHWKFHVARFNAVGKEFYHEHFKDDSLHKEAEALTKLWYKFLPDIMVDNHGVPSHEWEQQFSGYTSPAYKGFWLPRSLLYGYFWYVTDEEYKSNYNVNKAMEDVIAEEIASHSDMKALNQEWMERFNKFAHGWMPKLFPAEYYKEMINYWIPYAYDPNHRYPSIKFPWITSVAYTSEVADETAQGAYLNLCARAHVAHDVATIEMIRNCICVKDQVLEVQDNHILARCIRQRPVVISSDLKNKSIKEKEK